MITKNLVQVALIFTAVAIAGAANAATHYVDYATGNDSNAGTSTGSPWKHAPGMQGLTPSGTSTGDGCSANCASNTPAAGDQIIVDATDPHNLTVGTTGLVAGITAGANITINDTDPTGTYSVVAHHITACSAREDDSVRQRASPTQKRRATVFC